MNNRPLYIFDLDGTLADLKHRRHFVDGTDGKKDWNAFHAACVDDTPIYPIISILKALTYSPLCLSTDIYVWSGRMDTVQTETYDWLDKHVGLQFIDRLQMRPAGDYTPDDVLKRSWYDALSPGEKARLVCTFDDRDRIVKMWRDLGIVCLQVAPGDF